MDRIREAILDDISQKLPEKINEVPEAVAHHRKKQSGLDRIIEAKKQIKKPGKKHQRKVKGIGDDEISNINTLKKKAQSNKTDSQRYRSE